MGWTYVRTVGLECVDLLRRYMQNPLPSVESTSASLLKPQSTQRGVGAGRMNTIKFPDETPRF